MGPHKLVQIVLPVLAAMEGMGKLLVFPGPYMEEAAVEVFRMEQRGRVELAVEVPVEMDLPSLAGTGQYILGVEVVEAGIMAEQAEMEVPVLYRFGIRKREVLS